MAVDTVPARREAALRYSAAHAIGPTGAAEEIRRHEPARHARHLASLWNIHLAEAGRATLFYADGAAFLVLVPADRKISAPTLRSLLAAEELRVLRADGATGEPVSCFVVSPGTPTPTPSGGAPTTPVPVTPTPVPPPPPGC